MNENGQKNKTKQHRQWQSIHQKWKERKSDATWMDSWMQLVEMGWMETKQTKEKTARGLILATISQLQTPQFTVQESQLN